MIENYIIKRSKKRRKSIELKVINKKIVIYSPQKTTNEEIEKCYQKYKQILLNKIDFDKNETYVKYLGKKYPIKIEESELLKNPICEIKYDYFLVFKPKKQNISLEDIIEKWQINEARKIIMERIHFFTSNYNFNFSFNKNNIRFKNQTTKWGSCSYNNNLNFNFKVVEKPIDVIDYLVVHELSHTIYKNHSKRFWDHVGSVIGNYKELRNKLKY